MPNDPKCNTKPTVIELYKDFKYNLVDDRVSFKRDCCFSWTKRISLWTLKISLLILFILFIVGPFVYKYLYGVQRSLVFLNFVGLPRSPNYNKPYDYNLTGALNFYITTDDDVRLGVWQVLPENLVDNNTVYTEENFQRLLNNGQNVIIYNHGNSANRGSSHRVELYNVLKKNFHVICWDYRGYADSSNIEPTEIGLVRDATYIYKWVVNRTDSKIFIWGHSLGTGVSTHLLANLSRENIRKPTGLILESPFTSLTDEIAEHPFAKIFRPLPWFHYTIIEPMLQNGFVFASDKHIIKVDCPIMILHAEDDRIVPFHLGKKLYETAIDFRRKSQGNVTFISFDKKLSYGHLYICRATDIQDIISNFVNQSSIEVEQKKLY